MLFIGYSWFELVAPGFRQNVFAVLEVRAQLRRLTSRAFDLKSQAPTSGNRVTDHGLLDKLSFRTDADDGFHGVDSGSALIFAPSKSTTILCQSSLSPLPRRVATARAPVASVGALLSKRS